METISHEDIDGRRWIRLTGELDQSEVLELKGDFDAAVQGAEADVVVDLGGVAYMGTLGVGLLVTTQQRLSKEGRALKLANVPVGIEQTFETMALETFFERMES
ncbi:MAG: STAS domain-containing protein [Planctomycetota bacterium]|jgi:anti-anti-sigma factor